jgi:excisionase family DNA binding protein
MENKDFLTVRETSEYLNINEKKLYELAANGMIPATKVTGKWLFPFDSLKLYLKQEALKNLKSYSIDSLIDSGIILFAGSDDIVLNKIFNEFHIKHNGLEIYYSSLGSFKGIELLKDNLTHGATSHIFDTLTNEYNFSEADKILGEDNYIIINLFYRDIGFVSKKNISSFQEIYEKKYTFINRQKFSGVRNLSDYLIHKSNLDIKVFSEEMLTHFDIAKSVNEIENSVGIASKLASNIFNLNFNKIKEERFDLIINKNIFFKENFQLFINFLRENIQKEYKNIEGYRFDKSGELIFKNK